MPGRPIETGRMSAIISRSIARPKVDLCGFLPDEIADLLSPLDDTPYRGTQLFSWIQARRVTNFDEMTNLPASLREQLSRMFTISRMEPAEVLASEDGSSKLVFDVGDGSVSSVIMPSPERVTLCISSQVGCRMGCRFCLTGTMGRTRNLTPADMVGQVLAASRLVEPPARVSNVVFMGMGEPLDNLDNVIQAIRIMTHREGLRVAPRRTTLSTVGLLPRLRDFLAAETGASIALSLCGTTDAQRTGMTPVGKKYGLEDTVKALRDMRLGHGHRYTVEYLLIRGHGDSVDDARRLSRMLAHFPSKVNLIPFNPWPGSPLQRPTNRAVEEFRRFLVGKNHLVTVRESRGIDIGAACGQLGKTSDGEID